MLDPSEPLNQPFLDAVSAAISSFLDGQDRVLTSLSPTLTPLIDRARLFTSGGKRLRPAFCAWGHVAAGGEPDLRPGIVAVAASLDLLHVSALLHDDVMDASDQRRGVPSAHRQFAADHASADWRGGSAAFGRAAAILLGDLLLVWSEEMVRRSGLDAEDLDRARADLEALRTEVTAGQYLDIVAQAQEPAVLARTPEGRAELMALIRSVVTWKAASYTVRRPLLVGATLAGASPEAAEALTAFGQPLGRAFQYRDDVLGVFGSTDLTGKTSGEDLREGKLTLLIAEGFARATPTQAAELATLVGNPDLTPDQVERARAILLECGALAAVEAEIDREFGTALAALETAKLTERGRQGLQRLAHRAVRRNF
ncbi:MAG: polyprenyl synthetase family protein [Propioniciclava sp.]